MAPPLAEILYSVFCTIIVGLTGEGAGVGSSSFFVSQAVSHNKTVANVIPKNLIVFIDYILY